MELPTRPHREPPRLVALGGGRLALGHRPRKSALTALASEGCTHVLTLMTEREGALQVSDLARGAGLRWLWFPLENGNPLPPARDSDALELLDLLTSLLREGSSIFVHCSAGIHRTGMITHALLRRLGLPRPREALGELRRITADGVGDHRLAWGDRLVGPGLSMPGDSVTSSIGKTPSPAG